MEPNATNSEAPKQPYRVKPFEPGLHSTHSHHVQPLDPGYRLVVRIVLWLIAGAVLVGFCIWWMLT
jgi:hypothetical protein